MSRWKYKSAEVTAEGNSQTVRQLTAAERREFTQLDKLDPPIVGLHRMEWLVQKAATNPECSAQDVAGMPSELLDACVAKIMELSGLEAKGEETPEKKD